MDKLLFLTEEYLYNLTSYNGTGYDIKSEDETTGLACYVSRNPMGKQVIMINRNTGGLTIREDGGTRTVFHGMVFSQEGFETILSMVR